MSRDKSLLLRLGAGLTVVSLALTACSQKENNDSGGDSTKPAGYPEVEDTTITEGKPGGTFRMAVVEPKVIDPFNASESEGLLLTEYLYDRLTRTTPDGKTEPNVAESWETNDDCSVWTFHLKTGTKFHNGEDVTAESFKKGWERAATKDAASEVSYHMDQIQGYKEINTGAATEMSGVVATDPATLQVTLSSPSCEFYIRAAHTVFSPMPASAGPATDTAFNDMPIGNGPFQMAEPWQHGKGMTLKRFEGYTGKKAYLDKVEITVQIGSDAMEKQLTGLENDQFDWAYVAPAQLKDARAKYEPKKAWISKKTFGIDYLVAKGTEKPLDSPEARKAVSMAIDRNSIINGIFDGSKAPATTFIPGGFADVYQPGVCDACTYDPEKAKELAEKAGLKPGTKLNIQFNSGGGHKQWVAAVAENLKDNLGLEIETSEVEFNDMLNNIRQPGSNGLFRLSWGADYGTASNFLQPIFSTAGIGTTDPKGEILGDNNARYSNPEFDKLLEDAAKTKDEGARNKMYQQAEQIAIGRDLANIPMFERQRFVVFNPKFGNIGFMDFHENPSLSQIYVK